MKKNAMLSVFSLVLLMGFTMPQSSRIEALSKKWYLEKYVVFWVNYKPEENEKNDFIWLKEDMTYQSVDEGKRTSGNWLYNAENKTITLLNQNGEGINFNVKNITPHKLVLEMDIKEMEGVEIHFTTVKQ